MIRSAQWIWPDFHQKNAYALFKTTFTAPDGPVEVELSAEGNYALYLNGAFVNSGQYPDYPQYKAYDRLALAARPGENELLIRVYWPGVDHFSYRVEAPGLIFAVFSGDTLLAASGAATLAAPDPAYRCGEMEKITPQLGYTFYYDARKTATAQFAPARVAEKRVHLVPRPIKKLEIGARLPAEPIACGTFFERPWETVGQRMQNAALAAQYWNAQMWNPAGTVFTAEGGSGVYIVMDLGGEQVGFPELELTLPQDALILCGYGEHLQDLRVRAYVGGRNFAFSYYGILGENRFLMPLHRLGLRYLQLHIYAPSVTLRYAGVRPVTYPLEVHPLEISDLLHRRIYDTCVQTLRHCMHDHYEDTPWREQGLYTMDSRNEILCGYDVFHETEFPKACLRLIGLGVRGDGMAELCSPSRASTTIPAFTAVWLVELAEYLAASGDKAFLEEMLPFARRAAEAFARRIDPQSGLIGAFPEPGYWNYYEWQEGLAGKQDLSDPANRTYDAPLCAFVSMGFRAMEQIEEALAHPQEAVLYRARRQALNEKANAAFWNGSGYYSYIHIQSGAGSHVAQLTQALMVCCGACPAERRPAALRLLKEPGEALPITLSHSIFKYEALMTDPQNRDWMWRDIAKIWGNMLFRGATTFWETAEGAGDFRNAGSLCHGWSAIPLHLYHKYQIN